MTASLWSGLALAIFGLLSVPQTWVAADFKSSFPASFKVPAAILELERRGIITYGSTGQSGQPLFRCYLNQSHLTCSSLQATDFVNFDVYRLNRPQDRYQYLIAQNALYQATRFRSDELFSCPDYPITISSPTYYIDDYSQPDSAFSTVLTAKQLAAHNQAISLFYSHLVAVDQQAVLSQPLNACSVNEAYL